MMKTYLTLFICIVLTDSLFAQEKPKNVKVTVNQQQPPSARKIPGITAEDKFPNACIDCHVNKPQFNFDARLSTVMTKWFTSVDPEVLEKAKGTVAEGITLTGVHPMASAAWKNIPSACIGCHKARTNAPPFASVIHVIHLTGGENNHFLTAYQGECTNCHKLNQTTGAWTIPSGPEKQE
jgi:cytochrome c553